MTFTITEDSSITWLWETNVWIECAVSGAAAPEGETSGWFELDGASAVFAFNPSQRPFEYALTGDSDGISIDLQAGTVAIPTDRPRSLSLHVVTCDEAIATDGKPIDWATEPVAQWFVASDSSAVDGYSLRSGEIVANETSSVEAVLSGSGTLSFKWKVPAGRGDYARVYLDGEVQKSIQRVTAWQTVTLDIPAGKHTVRWSYERGTGSATGEDAAFLDDVDWRPEVSLAIASAFGTAKPDAGTHTLVYGDEVVASVVAPEPENGVQYVCTGWTGMGSVPESGTGTNIAFTIESDSSIQWNWQTNIWISVAANGPVGVDVADGWFALGETVVAHYSPNVDFFTLALSGDTDGVVLDESARTIAISADRPRSVTLSVAELTLKSALDAGKLSWETSGSATWFPQVAVSADGISSARSGSLSGGDDVSALETTVQGGGTFAWSWRLGVSGDSNSGVDILLDGEWLDAYYPGTDWSRETLEIIGDGTHTIRFEFWNAGPETGDCAYLDQVSWSGGVPSHGIVIGDMRIPSDWIDENAASALAKANGDYETAANAMAANMVNKVWECYVAGISPTDETARFEATIEIVGGKPVVRWNPPLSAEEEAKRIRKVLGKRSLDDPDGWQDMANIDDIDAVGYRFFKVSVEMK